MLTSEAGQFLEAVPEVERVAVDAARQLVDVVEDAVVVVFILRHLLLDAGRVQPDFFQPLPTWSETMTSWSR